MPDAPALWEAIDGRPHPRLRGGVLSYTGYVERATRPMRRLEVPSAGIPLIVSLGPSLPVDTTTPAPPSTGSPRRRASTRRKCTPTPRTDEVDALHGRAVAAGAEIVRPLQDTDCGSREFSARDPEGNHWSFGTYSP